MGKRVALTALLASITVAGGVGALAGRPASLDNIQLASALTPFEQCDELHDYMRREAHAQLVSGRFGGGLGPDMIMEQSAGSANSGRAPSPPAASSARSSGAAVELSAGNDAGSSTFSTTNVQEAGIDEPDIVKSDGRSMFVVRRGEVVVLDITRPEVTVASRLPLAAVPSYGEPLLLLEDGRLLIISQAMRQEAPGATQFPGDARVGISPYAPMQPITTVLVVDVGDPRSPETVAELELDGGHVSSRLVDGVARIVLRSMPGVSVYPARDMRGTPSAAAPELPPTELEDWLPGYRLSNGAGRVTSEGLLSECGSVRRPEEFSGFDVLSVVSVDPKDPRPKDAAAIVGAGDTVYASGPSLYVSTTSWQPGTTETNVHKFNIADPDAARHVASGTVPGSVLNQFSLSEHEGVLRVATTTAGAPASRGAGSESGVHLLRQNGAELAEIGAVTGLGKGERIYAVRFIGDKGYVVTFRQTDPLYVLDLADPERPLLRGELKVPGYSAYLHPVGEDLLLGVGRDATDEGRTTGTQVSLFDVADPANPRRLSVSSIPGASSEVEQDHHAFLWWPAEKLAVVPVISVGGAIPNTFGMPVARNIPIPRELIGRVDTGAATFRVADGTVTETERLRHPDAEAIRRIIVSNGRLLTVSGTGVMTSDLSTLTAGAWLGL